MKWYEKLCLTLFLAAVGVPFALFVWPTPWSYSQVGRLRERRHRVTGAIQRYSYDSGRWETAKRRTKLEKLADSLRER